MAGQHDKCMPFIKFHDVSTRDSHLEYHNMNFGFERGFMLHRVEEKDPALYAHLVEFG